MYHVTSRFILADLSPVWEKVMKAVEPLERFTHEIQTTDTVPMNPPKDTTAVILRADENCRPEKICEGFAPTTRIIVCTDSPEKLSEESLDVLDDIWPLEPTEALAQYYVERLYHDIKEDMDAWLTKQYLDTTINTSPDMIWFKDKKGAHLKVNDAFCHVVGKPREDIEGRGHYYIWGLTKEQYDKGEFVCLETEEEVMRKGVTCVFDEHVMDADSIRLLQTYKTPLWDIDGTIMGTVGIARDVTKLRSYEAELLAAARSDELTGLANRRYFYEYIEQNRADQTLTIARIDLSYFKQLNDTYGAQCGDNALIAVAGFLREVFSEAMVCRFGGGEFLLAYIGACPLDGLKQKFKKVLDKISEYCEKDKNPILLSANMGITTTGDASQPIDALIRQCDLALYFTRSLGDGQCCVFSEIVNAD
ncbi:MAG: diguanylate cyclase [Schwartzia succinivorans]|uniref:sensor domain-containing diguanylate cyclase n=1 Tax=Schwartzia succinivorans TaxID=55507 RepID=UPI0023558792|nr:diguanylate cyclase [Schwartzia succinivorans]MBE6097239.1 diguanylate cyclase [Schwartzia succinivorans]